EKSKAFKRGDPLRTLILRRSLWEAVDTWLPPDKAVSLTEDRYRVSLKKLKAHGGLPADVHVADLETFDWAAFKATEHFQSAADWNALRRAVSRFLTLELGDKYHPARRAIMAKIPRAKAHARKVHLSAGEFWKLIDKASPAVQAGIVTMAVTGMRLGEYERARTVHLTTLPGGMVQIDVQGSKTDGSTATVAVAKSLAKWIAQGIPMPFKRLWFRRLYKRAAVAIGRPELTLHDLRHCTAMFSLEGGAPINAVRDLMRHEGAEQTLDYARTGNVQQAAKAIGKALKRRAG
ncbi:MAG: hypothetical protein Q8K55_08940, partial [Gemmatimonadaceae bacterium]|nr:hypothetical protein [Gemmatimonadaceae bacterium]